MNGRSKDKFIDRDLAVVGACSEFGGWRYALLELVKLRLALKLAGAPISPYASLRLVGISAEPKQEPELAGPEKPLQRDFGPSANL